MGTVKGRLANACRELQSAGVRGLIAFSDGQNSFLESNAVFVLSGVRPIGESAVVIDAHGQSTLVLTPSWDLERSRNDRDPPRSGALVLLGSASPKQREFGTKNLIAT